MNGLNTAEVLAFFELSQKKLDEYREHFDQKYDDDVFPDVALMPVSKEFYKAHKEFFDQYRKQYADHAKTQPVSTTITPANLREYATACHKANHHELEMLLLLVAVTMEGGLPVSVFLSKHLEKFLSKLNKQLIRTSMDLGIPMDLRTALSHDADDEDEEQDPVISERDIRRFARVMGLIR